MTSAQNLTQADDTGRTGWRKSSYSGADNACVEIRATTSCASVQDSKHPGGPTLSFDAEPFRSFILKVTA
jgi:Domain of unknown function (DUF397)